MKTRTTASATLQASLRLHQHAGVAGEIVMPGDAAEAEPEPDAGRQPEAVVHLHRLEADIVGVFQHRDGAGAVEGDVEFARQAVERAVVEDVEMPLAGKRPRVDQFLRIDAGGRRAGDVADIVGAGAARAQPEILDRLDHGDRVAGLDLADLQIGARRDMRITAAIALGEIGDAGELRRLENAVRDAQPAHIGVLVRRDVEQAEKTPAEIVRRLRIFALGGVILEPLVGVERMLLALELLLIGEFLAGGEDAVLRLEPGGIGPDRLGRRRGGPARRRRRNAFRRLGDLHAGDEPFQVALLFGVEIAGLFGGSGLEVSLAHSAGTCVGAVERRGRGGARLVGEVERKPGKDEAADQIAERDRYLIPQPPFADGDLGAHHHAGRNDEHVDHRMLEALREEDEDRHVGAGDLADGRRRGHGGDDGEADQPVAEDRLDEHGDEAGVTERLVAGGLGLGDGDDFRRRRRPARWRRNW